MMTLGLEVVLGGNAVYELLDFGIVDANGATATGAAKMMMMPVEGVGELDEAAAAYYHIFDHAQCAK